MPWPGISMALLACAGALAIPVHARQVPAAATTEQAPVPGSQSGATVPPARGKVLFERHEETAPENQPVEPAPSPNTRKSRPLQRRDAAGKAAETTETSTEKPVAPATGFSSGTDLPLISSPKAEDARAAQAISDEDRRALRIRNIDLDMHLNQHTGETSVRARVLLQNSGTAPLARASLQISSALHWQSATVRLAGTSQALPYEEHRLTTDADHTGAASEIGLTLPVPLGRGGELTVELFYGGTLQANSDRLLRLGAPGERAAQSEWDTVSDAFTGLRGFGNVLWFPVSSAPAFLADGADFSAAVDAQRTAFIEMSLRLVLQTNGAKVQQAFFLGRPAALSSVPGADAQPGDEGEQTFVQTAEWKAVSAGPHPVSLFLTSQPLPRAEDDVAVSTGDGSAAAAYRAAAARVRPLLTAWLGEKPAAPLTVLDLPVANGQPFADGALLVLPVAVTDGKLLASALVYPLAAAWLPQDAPAWLGDGLPEFVRLLYLEQTAGRDRLLAELNAGGGVLAREESFRTGASQALAVCVSTACTRVKAAYVFTMLRQIVGDNALQQAITGMLSSPNALQQKSSVCSDHLQKSLHAASGKDLQWFFKDWIDTDAGLPELTIVSVAPRRVERSTRTDYLPTQKRPVGGPIGAEPVAQAGDPALKDSATEASRGRVAPAEGSWLVAVEVQNSGDAAAEVPVTVRASGLQNTLPLRIAAHSRATVRVPFEAAPEEVWVNDGSVPEMHSVTHHKSIEIPAEAR